MHPISVYMILLLQHDLQKAVDFYKSLGLTCNFHLPQQWAEFNLNGVKVGLVPVKEQLPDRPVGIVLQVANLEEFQKTLETQGSKFFQGPTVNPQGIMASFKDPGNNIIDIYQPGSEKKS